MSKEEATIIQNFNAEKRQYEYSVKGYDVTKSIEILLKKHKEEYDKERRVFESTKGYLEAQQEYEKHIANLQSQLDQANERLKGAIVPKFSSGQIVYFANIVEGTVNKFNYIGEDKYNYVVEDKTGEVFIRMKERTFATEQEAQAKLKEIQGNE